MSRASKIEDSSASSSGAMKEKRRKPRALWETYRDGFMVGFGGYAGTATVFGLLGALRSKKKGINSIPQMLVRATLLNTDAYRAGNAFGTLRVVHRLLSKWMNGMMAANESENASERNASLRLMKSIAVGVLSAPAIALLPKGSLKDSISLVDYIVSADL